MLQSIFETCHPREEILSGELALDLFAAKLRLVVEGKAPHVYQDANTFFSNTFPTDGIKTLIRETFSRLTQQGVGSPAIRLETSFGGGKTHDLIALWHICKEGRRIQGLDRFADLSLIPSRSIQVAAVDGRDLDPEQGIYHKDTGVTTYTLWGEIAYQIGGISGYELLRGSDTSGSSPGTSVLERLLGGEPTVIALDEMARYLRSAKAKVLGKTDLAGQVVAFLFSLMDLAASCNHLVLIYSLASTADTFGEETRDLQEAMSASARQERVLSPSTDIEIYNIVKQRMFAMVSEDAAEKAAGEYLSAYRASRLDLPEGCKDASYSQAIAQSYPFHPELFNLLTKKIASIPEFQTTRGALRLFAQVLRYLWRDTQSWIPMIHTHHIPVGLDSEITDDLTSRLQRPQMRPPIGADIYNADGRRAYAQVQDEEWQAAGKPPFSTWVTRTIFLHSLTQGISSGIRKSELNLSLLTPSIESGFIDRVLERILAVAWYLDFDPIAKLARFKEEPSINKIITEEKEQVGLTEAKADLRERRDSIFAKKLFDCVKDPDSPSDVDDKPDDVVLCLIDFAEGTVTASTDEAPPLVHRIFENTGDSGKFRTYRNRLLFLVANRYELEKAVENAREYKAIKNILRSQNRLQDLSESQQKQLREKEGLGDLAVRISLTNAYRHLFYPSNDPVKAPKGLMHYTLTAQDSSTVKKNNQQEVILKALKDCTKIRGDDAKPFAPAFILQKVWPAGLDFWTTKALRDAFAKDLSLNILLDAEVARLRYTILQGLQEGSWDLKVGERLFIKTAEGSMQLPDTLEFSDRMVLYRRGILEPPIPKTIELSAQLLPSSDAEKSVRVRWRAKGALTVSLYENERLIPGNFRPSDEYETTVNQTCVFRAVADYGNGETLEQETRVSPEERTGLRMQELVGSSYSVEAAQPSLFEVKSPTIQLDGTLNAVFAKLTDRLSDDKVATIESLEIAVDRIMDYRKLGTAIALLQRFQPEIDQTATVQSGDRFVRLEYQGPVSGFMDFFRTLSSLLNSPEVQGEVNLKIAIAFNPAIVPTGSELATIKQHLDRNPVERLMLTVNVTY